MRLDAMETLRIAIDAYPRVIAPRLSGLFSLLFQVRHLSLTWYIRKLLELPGACFAVAVRSGGRQKQQT